MQPVGTSSVVAVIIALALLCLCVLIFASAAERPRFRPYLLRALWILGIAPGIGGVVWGFASFVGGDRNQIVLPAFLLLEIGSAALLRAAKTLVLDARS